MQSSMYSAYDDYYKANLESLYSLCQIKGATNIIMPPKTIEPKPKSFCASALTYLTTNEDTCDTIAMHGRVSAVALFDANKDTLTNCNNVRPNETLCLPFHCDRTYEVTENDNCETIEKKHGLERGSLSVYNPWLTLDCRNLQSVTSNLGRVICLSPSGGTYKGTAPPSTGSQQQGAGGRGTR
jgi:hypothetical protein